MDSNRICPLTQQETAEYMVKAAIAKHETPPAQTFVKGLYGGAFLSFGGLISLVAGSSTELQADNSGLARIISAFGT